MRQARLAGAEDAWARTIGVERLDALEREFSEYVAGRAGWDLMQARVEERPAPPVEHLRAMSDEEIHLLWARIVRWPTLAEGQLAEARAHAQGSVELSYARGCFALRHGRYAMSTTQARSESRHVAIR